MTEPDAAQLVDSHAHLDDARFDADREAMLARAAAAGVRAIVVPAVAAEGWTALHELCSRTDLPVRLHPGFGLHPMFLHAHRDAHLQALVDQLQRVPHAAVGECGLDFHVEGLDADRQRQLFEAQLVIARDLGRPVIVHARKAVEDVIHTMRRIGRLRGVVHSFAGSEEQARQLWDMGIHIGLGGPLTYGRAHRLHRLVASMPLEQLLLETDAPDQPDAAHRGERNEPARLTEILHRVAVLRETDEAEIARQTARNACALFGLDCAGAH